MQCLPEEKKMTIFTLTGAIWETGVILGTHSNTAGDTLKVLVFELLKMRVTSSSQAAGVCWPEGAQAHQHQNMFNLSACCIAGKLTRRACTLT